MRVRGGDGSDVVRAIVLHRFEMRRKKKKKKRKTYLNVLVEPSFFCKVVGCMRKGEVGCEGNKGLTFFLRGGTKYSERWRWLACTCKAHKSGCHRAAGMPQKDDMTATG